MCAKKLVYSVGCLQSIDISNADITELLPMKLFSQISMIIIISPHLYTVYLGDKINETDAFPK